ncbi:LuxR family transcriptional regulator [Actinomadura soli]|uniref:LuxR family transcriptional regulator n=1 Tax=Actinomadura soli TaxID=2508997 RepID=A0A5C4JD44_9ACTN|nr:LuxR family transcriptional regulator [Actinomadura soli]TMR01166.1 LuxR family transcriptional regulator [Actinomadura soli]
MHETKDASRAKQFQDGSAPEDSFGRTLRYLRSHAEQAALALREMESQLTSLAGAEGTRAAAVSGGFEPLEGTDTIDRRIAAAIGRCRAELLTAQPGGSRDGERLRTALERDRRALRRGASMRTLYQHTARHDRATVAYVDEISAAGAEVRTFDEFFNRLIIVDRRICFLPGSPDGATAVAVTVPAVVRYLADVFDRVWQRSDPFAAYTTHNITTPVQSRIVRMLIDGETGTVIAKRLGISDRTFAKRVARMKADYGVLTHFQLGYEIGRRS